MILYQSCILLSSPSLPLLLEEELGVVPPPQKNTSAKRCFFDRIFWLMLEKVK